jgi:hypothetical protein
MLQFSYLLHTPYCEQHVPKLEFKQVAPPLVEPQDPSVLTLTLVDGDGAAELGTDPTIGTLDGAFNDDDGAFVEEDAGAAAEEPEPVHEPKAD